MTDYNLSQIPVDLEDLAGFLVTIFEDGEEKKIPSAFIKDAEKFMMTWYDKLEEMRS